MSPSNTAIVKGYNALTGSNVKLGQWSDYLAMRTGVLRLNGMARDLLSNDLGAIAGLLFDMGTSRYAPPPVADDAAAREVWERDVAAVRDRAKTEPSRTADADATHAEV